MPAHTHDGVDWAARLTDLRQADAANAAALRAVADRLIEAVPAPRPTVIDVGSGAGGMSAALAAALVGRAARAATVPVAGEDPAGFHQPPGTMAETGQSTAPPTTDQSADATLAANLDPASRDRPTDTVAQTGHSTKTDSKLPAEAPVGRAADPTPTAANPDSASSRPANAPIHGDRPADPTSAAAHAGAATSRPVSVAVHGSHAAAPAAMAARPAGATLVLVDVVPELLAAAEEAAVVAVGGSGAVDVRTVRADVADPASLVGLPSADLVWASNVVHHLPDQRAAVLMLARLLAPGGCLALSEGGLSMRCLPWDVGVGEPGLQDRLIAAHGTWFHRMRADMPDAVRLPVGWNQVLGEAGLSGVTAFSYLVDVPAPLSDAGRGAVVSWLSWMSHAAADLLDQADIAALGRLLDPDDPAYVARRDDIFMLKASTVYLGWR